MALQVKAPKAEVVNLAWSPEPTLGRKTANPASCPNLCCDTQATT